MSSNVRASPYHLSVKVVSRGARVQRNRDGAIYIKSGRSAVAAAAYRSATKLSRHIDGREVLVHDFTRKKGVRKAFIIAPAGADWALDRELLWNRAEDKEPRRDACTGREYEVAIPASLCNEAKEELVAEFAQFLVEKFGIVADVAIHAASPGGDQRNDHAHILTTTRAVTPIGLGKKTRNLDSRKTGPGLIREIRERWANLCNAELAKAGHHFRVDHRSYKERNLIRMPTIHEGAHSTALRRRTGIALRTVQKNEEIDDWNVRVAKRFQSLSRALAIANETPKLTKPLTNLTEPKQHFTAARQFTFTRPVNLHRQNPLLSIKNGRQAALTQRLQIAVLSAAQAGKIKSHPTRVTSPNQRITMPSPFQFTQPTSIKRDGIKLYSELIPPTTINKRLNRTNLTEILANQVRPQYGLTLPRLNFTSASALNFTRPQSILEIRYEPNSIVGRAAGSIHEPLRNVSAQPNRINDHQSKSDWHEPGEISASDTCSLPPHQQSNLLDSRKSIRRPRSDPFSSAHDVHRPPLVNRKRGLNNRPRSGGVGCDPQVSRSIRPLVRPSERIAERLRPGKKFESTYAEYIDNLVVKKARNALRDYQANWLQGGIPVPCWEEIVANVETDIEIRLRHLDAAQASPNGNRSPLLTIRPT